jgi:ribosome assembly protein YihI (activator of Der GTPase)
MLTPDVLHAALVVLRDAEVPLDRRHDRTWRVVDAWLRQTWPGGGADGDELRQETMIAVARSVRGMEASAPLQAAKWLAMIHRRKVLDKLRAEARDLVRRGLARGGGDDEEGTAPLDRIEGELGVALDEGSLERLLSTIEEHVEAELRERETSATGRHLKRLQARAALHRLVLDAELEALMAVLDAGEPLTRERVYKWVERGRAWVIAGLERWVREEGEGSEAALLAAAVRERIAARRADAGKPRPQRRRSEEET